LRGLAEQFLCFRSIRRWYLRKCLALTRGTHNVKFCGTIGATRLHEQFTFGITDPTDGAFAADDGNLDPALAPSI
jgi:hypothetical protein